MKTFSLVISDQGRNCLDHVEAFDIKECFAWVARVYGRQAYVISWYVVSIGE